MKRMSLVTLEEINAEISRLTAAKQVLLNKERAAAIHRVKEAIKTYGIISSELFGEVGSKSCIKPAIHGRTNPAPKTKLKKKQNRVRGPQPIKYKDAKGNSWAGLGKTPRWLLNHLDQGAAREDFLVTERGV